MNAPASTRTGPLEGRRIAILATDGFEPSELADSLAALDGAGASTKVISPHGGVVRSDSTYVSREVPVDVLLDRADAEQYDGLLIPGGASPERLRDYRGAARFVRAFFDADKPVAAFGDGPLLLIDAGVTEDHAMTSAPAIAQPLRNAGARWSDQEVVVDRGLVTSRRPADIAAFNAQMLDEFAKRSPQGRNDQLAEG